MLEEGRVVFYLKKNEYTLVVNKVSLEFGMRFLTSRILKLCRVERGRELHL